MSQETSRRSFMKRSAAATAAVGGVTGCMCGLSGCTSKAPKVAKGSVTKADGKVVLELAKIPELGKVGGFVRLKDKGVPEPVLVIHAAENTYATVSAKCTHFGMGLSYVPEKQHVRCGSFGHSTFTLDGKVTQGPAKKHLKVYATALKDGKLEITV